MSDRREPTQVFILRIWFEPREIPGADPPWRAVIEHVTSGKRQYFSRLEEITTYLQTYLQSGEIGGKNSGDLP